MLAEEEGGLLEDDIFGSLLLRTYQRSWRGKVWLVEEEVRGLGHVTWFRKLPCRLCTYFSADLLVSRRRGCRNSEDKNCRVAASNTACDVAGLLGD